MAWVLALGGLSGKELARRVWSRIWDHAVLDRAAQLSYYFLLALFPLLIFLSAVLGAFVLSDFHLYNRLLGYLAAVMPFAAFTLVQETINQVTQAADGGKVSIGLVLALWTASSGTAAVIDGLNEAYEVKDDRPWWRVRLTALLLTVIAAILALAGLVLIVSGDTLAEWIGWHWGLGQTAAQWLVIAVCLLAALTVVYRFGPCLKNQRWQALMPGSLTALLSWVLVSLGLRLYLHFFNSYNKTYGSLGAVIVLLLWLYVTGISMLLGAEVNAEIEHAAALAGAEEAKAPGESEPAADHHQVSNLGHSES